MFETRRVLDPRFWSRYIYVRRYFVGGILSKHKTCFCFLYTACIQPGVNYFVHEIKLMHHSGRSWKSFSLWEYWNNCVCAPGFWLRPSQEVRGGIFHLWHHTGAQKVSDSVAFWIWGLGTLDLHMCRTDPGQYWWTKKPCAWGTTGSWYLFNVDLGLGGNHNFPLIF